MHESGLTKSLMKKIEEVRLQNGGKKVTVVEVWLGAFSHFTKEHFEEHFRIESKGTPSEGAKLIMTLSDDTDDPNAQGVVLERIEVVH